MKAYQIDTTMLLRALPKPTHPYITTADRLLATIRTLPRSTPKVVRNLAEMRLLLGVR